MNRHRHGSASDLGFWAHWLPGMGAVITTLCLLTWLKIGDVTQPYRILAALTVLASIPVFILCKVYFRADGLLKGSLHLLAGWTVLQMVLTLLAFATKTGSIYSREVLLTWMTLGFVVLWIPYAALWAYFKRRHEKKRTRRKALIVGTGQLAQLLADKLQRQRMEPVVGLVSTDDNYPDDGLYPVLGNLDQLHQLIVAHRIQRLYLALPLEQSHRVQQLYIDLLDTPIDVTWLPDLHSVLLLNHSVTDIKGLPAIHLNESPLTSYPTAALTKAVLDRSAALLLLIVFSPLLLGIALLVKRSSPGPVLFKQQRHGYNGKIFKVYKFRSMRMHDDSEVKQATRNDSRVTPIGRFIRRTSIDELPQLFNVLQGKMSLVGPRPHAVAHNNYYTDKISAYMARHRIKPGITGWAQVNGCRGETDTLDKMKKRLELDLIYINTWSIWLDIKILLKTPFTLLDKNIY